MAENFVAEAFSLLAIGIVIIVLRLVSRIITVGVRKLAADDFLMIVAGVCFRTLAAHYSVNIGY